MSAPIFTRRHYLVVADLIRDADYLEPDTRGQLVEELCECFAADNERFRPDTFRTASGNGDKAPQPPQ